MRKHQVMLVASMGLLLSACVSNGTGDKKSAKTINKVADSDIAYEDRVTCTTRAMTGSRLKKKRCITNRQKALEQEAAQDVIREATNGVGEAIN